MPTSSGIRQDQYVLGQSQKKSIDEIGEEIRLDLSLSPNPNLNGGTIEGTVKNSNGDTVPNTLIKIMSSTYEPLAHTFTGTDGTFIFSPFPPGTSYRIFASAQGYTLAENIPFTLLSNQDSKQDFILTADPNESLGIIAGDAFRSDTGSPINGAAVSLYTVSEGNVEKLYAVSFTNKYGQYVFSDLPQANYKTRINALGFYGYSTSGAITAGGQIINSIANINANPNASRGTVSGLILDNNNQPVANADVTLYKVSSVDESLTAVAYGKANSDGAYLFINVEEGNYLIKSNKYVVPQQV